MFWLKLLRITVGPVGFKDASKEAARGLSFKLLTVPFFGSRYEFRLLQEA